MSNKTRLQTNNINLQELINKANALPDAGGESNTQSKTVSLQVKKITSDTYANETTYTGEQFILLNIYPKTNGTVSVTYGGLTKTITDTGESSYQQVFFGTFNGVSDSTDTPSSGELTIEGDYRKFGVGVYNSEKSTILRCGCVTAVNNLGRVVEIGSYAFSGCTDLVSITIPDSVTRILGFAFNNCSGLTSITISDGIASIDSTAFSGCTGLTSIVLPNRGIEIGSTTFVETAYYKDQSNWFDNMLYIGNHLIKATTISDSCQIKNETLSIAEAAFENCVNLTNIQIPANVVVIGKGAFSGCTSLTSLMFVGAGNETVSSWYATRVVNEIAGTEIDATCLTDTYVDHSWRRYN